MLAEEGFLDCNANRKGSIIVGNQTRRKVNQTTLACLLRPSHPRNNVDNFGVDMIEGVRGEVSRRGYRLVYHWLDETDCAARVWELVEQNSVSGILLDQLTPLSVIGKFAESPLPVVLYNRFEPSLNISAVLPDYEAIGRQTAAMLAKSGWERLAFFKIPNDEWAWDEKLSARGSPLIAVRGSFVREAETLGFTGPDLIVLPEQASKDVADEPESFGLPRRKPADWKRLGIFACSDIDALNIIGAVAKTDLVLGRDVGVIGCYDLDICKQSAVPPSSWKIDAFAVGVEAARELIRRVKNPQAAASVIKLPADFVDRKTA
jgi:DNA-binding LacI/PurR family transcriptional regulator